jgi:hypothetical protein
VTVCGDRVMLRYLDEPGARERLPGDLERLDAFLAREGLDVNMSLQRPNPDYVSLFRPGVRVRHERHLEKGVGVLLGERPEVPGWFQVRMDDGEILVGDETMLKIVPAAEASPRADSRPMNDDYRLIDATPSAADYRRLRESAGLRPKSAAAWERRSWPGSWNGSGSTRRRRLSSACSRMRMP